MKKVLTYAVTLLLGQMLMTSNAIAGTAFINNFQVDGAGYTCFRFSNVSAVDGQLTVTLYDINGNVYQNAIHDTNFIQSLGAPFVVPPKKTARFCLRQDTYMVGYGVVESETVGAQEVNHGQVRFIGQAFYANFAGTTSYAIAVNNNMPF